MSKIISKSSLTGSKLQTALNNADSDDRLAQIIASMRHHGLHVSQAMLDDCSPKN